MPLTQGTALAGEQQQAQQAEDIVLIKFRQPDTDESSDPQDRPRGGGSRQICKTGTNQSEIVCTNQSLTALVPSNQLSSNTSSAWGLTVEGRPTLWFYVPYSSNAIHQVIFELLDSNGTKIFVEDTLKLSDTPGIIGYRPPLSQALEIHKTYRWHLLLRLDPASPSGDAYISGRIKRIARPPHLQQGQDLRQFASTLAKAGIWYDTLTVVSNLYADDPRYWQSLLTSVGLKDFIEEPISRCCASSK
ncbi:DUF928 domain-containing protein [Acaryochloris sp. IP29b_bin.148]|uniref:DUF928 domain-containing protein n=1 Tax=Acaryochloris sp. IP29b_bin.148 TaxID=2969218 RepID=UPI002616C133|nr:DUF928 domain-containing protein [Acaryochloris sp. IP29b_bin.148]